MVHGVGHKTHMFFPFNLALSFCISQYHYYFNNILISLHTTGKGVLGHFFHKCILLEQRSHKETQPPNTTNTITSLKPISKIRIILIQFYFIRVYLHHTLGDYYYYSYSYYSRMEFREQTKFDIKSPKVSHIN